MLHPLATKTSVAILILTSLCCVRVCHATGGEEGSKFLGDPAGIERAARLDRQLSDLAVKTEHPRIILTPELIATARARIARKHHAWEAIRLAAAKDTIAAAFCFAVTGDASYAARVFEKIMSENASPWTVDHAPDTAAGTDRKVAEWAIAFDWVYNGLKQNQRDALVAKLAAATNVAGRAAWLRAGNRIDSSGGETFHREEWIFRAWRAWPEIALAGHVPDAAFCYKSRWDKDSIYGDAARAFAYLNDGTPLEGYQYGADGISWLMALKSATGINLVDGTDFHYAIAAADYQLYGTDFGLNRNVFHHGVGLGAGGLASYRDTVGNNFNWKTKEYHSRAVQLTADRNPYQQWIAQNLLSFDKAGASSWIFTNEYYGFWNSFKPIATLLFYDPASPAADPRQAGYEALPYAKLFPGGNEVYMRSSWNGNAAMACFRATPAFTKTSHGDFDVNTFVLYRRGNLAPDSGVYDVYQGQKNYFGYQKNTVAHNNILVIDPSKPDAPKKFNANPDPGGTELVTTRTFGRLHRKFNDPSNTFLYNDRADWGDIISFETTKDFDYAVGEAAKAYGTRADEYTRSVLFLRKNSEKAYFVIFDRVGSTNADFKKKWLLHTVNEPALNGRVTGSEIPDHIYTTDGDTYSATNAFNNAALYGKVLLPRDHVIRKVGGDGYMFWVDGSTPKNWEIQWADLAADKERFTGGPLQEIGQWRLEVMPSTQQKRDLFLNVIYLGDVGEVPALIEALESTDGKMTGAYIRDAAKPWIVLFPCEKHGDPAPGSVTYRFPLGDRDPEHVVTGLAPNTPYTVHVSVDGATTLVNIVPEGGTPGTTPRRSSAAGVLSFVAGAH
jgi:hypothetical protein